jgi:ribonuclease T2
MKHILLAAALLSPLPVAAQAYQCAIPTGALPALRADLPDERSPQRLLPIGGYTLAISWSPNFCRGKQFDPDKRLQCGGQNRFGFVLHGLWPDGEGKDWPQYCAATPLLAEATVRRNLCATPSPQLLQHEWAKHGTCMAGETPDSYFRRSTTMYRRLRFPDMDRLSRGPLTAGRFAQAMARANRGIGADMMRVTADKNGWLDEVWLCLDRRFRYQTCPAHQGGLKPSAPLKIWRGRR